MKKNKKGQVSQNLILEISNLHKRYNEGKSK